MELKKDMSRKKQNNMVNKFDYCCPIKKIPMSQKLRFSIMGSEPIKFRTIMPNFELKSQYLGQGMPRRGDFASMTSNWFIGGLFLKFACPTTDDQLLTSRFLRFSVFIGQQ